MGRQHSASLASLALLVAGAVPAAELPLIIPTVPAAAEEDGPTMVAPDAPSLEVRMNTCTDVAPGTRHTCEQQRLFGKCDAEYMTRYNYCAKTCGRAPCKACDDVQPTSEYNCTQQAEFGKCGESWMIEGGYCARTCNRLPCPPSKQEMEDAALAYSKQQKKARGEGAAAETPAPAPAPTPASVPAPAPAPAPATSPSSAPAPAADSGQAGQDFIPFPGPQGPQK
ncbi:hypothetical protein GPECTOR_33g632 [Gonium pectorale]|uniref:ShKT domain-containing protein n=1 Tax=Gonium pectorale TaxID=33097 RepID=A0A150GEH4_GONPE|nr:hypothetical protein GPECTOR_33g632 [Gonium pectorale]|eukprot:KXZ47750.1 hypothetical protein GPECTOR_33g632 [Gonium pectorale]